MDINSHRTEIFIITKDGGALLHKYSVLGMDDNKIDELTSGFLTALNNFASDIGFPSGVSLIRSGSLEARFSPGKHIFSVLIIDYNMPLGLMTEPVLSGMANDITDAFETKYSKELEKGSKSNIFRSDDYNGFKQNIDDIINQYGNETFELYQKLVLIESMYAKVPQKWCIPLIEKISEGEQVLDEWPAIIKKYPNMKKAIEKVNFDNAPVWEIFAIPLFKFDHY